MIDLVDRQAAIDKVDSLYRDAKNDECYMITGHNHALSDMRTILNALPSAYPETDGFCDGCKEYDQERHFCPRFDRVIKKTIDEIKTEQRWIPCSERLPKKHGESYLVTISDGAVYTAALQWDANGKRWYLSFLNDGNILVDFIDDVIAWMPLPEPYKEET